MQIRFNVCFLLNCKSVSVYSSRRVASSFRSSLRMHRQTLSILLLAVLIPLLNLGPSLHHLTCFGLHGQCEHEHTHCATGHRHGNCCAGHHHAPSERSSASLSTADFPRGFADSDCPLCQFFSHFNAIGGQYSLAAESYRCNDVAEREPAATFAEQVFEHARGPPCSFV